jgi:hypothetical protein
LALRLQRKEKVVSIVEHSPQDRLDQEIIGIDQHVVGLKTRKRKDQMQAAILILEIMTYQAWGQAEAHVWIRAQAP